MYSSSCYPWRCPASPAGSRAAVGRHWDMQGGRWHFEQPLGSQLTLKKCVRASARLLRAAAWICWSSPPLAPPPSPAAHQGLVAPEKFQVHQSFVVRHFSIFFFLNGIAFRQWEWGRFPSWVVTEHLLWRGRWHPMGTDSGCCLSHRALGGFPWVRDTYTWWGACVGLLTVRREAFTLATHSTQPFFC